MALDGTYGFVYCGSIGLGLGVFTVVGNVLRGTDYAGGKYFGSAIENADGSITLALDFDVAAGIVLVQGTAPQDLPHRRKFDATMPAVRRQMI